MNSNRSPLPLLNSTQRLMPKTAMLVWAVLSDEGANRVAARTAPEALACAKASPAITGFVRVVGYVNARGGVTMTDEVR